ncbi:ROK family protein [Ktedonosporobacter rubrisoli]|uniref:ROK family protein n=1 Tax=Ktedonosporobacter rubrisoli TaxID=2509675 RepID=A0A4P6K3W9_KTERU|nr:ROK family protein [Ktedonosporobacter rubrisoli]QBD82967.1 ROK family protein [Ktedonosporobacter rubrisoli]
MDDVQRNELLVQRAGPQAIAPVVLAFDVGGTRIKAGIVQEAEVLAMLVEPLPATKDAASLIEALVQIGQRLLVQQSVEAVGISMKGIIDPQQGTILDVNEALSALIGLPLARLVTQAFGLPVWIENDARMYTVGELVYGAGKQVENLLCLTLGTGVGCGVALQRRVIRGGRGLFGILGGHITVESNGPRCSCGNIGCLEALIGTAALRQKAAELHVCPVDDALTPRAIFAAAAAGSEAANAVVAHFTHYLSVGLVSLIHTYDPDIVVLGGGIAYAAAQFLPAVQRYVDEHTWSYPRGRVRIKTAKLGDSAALIGAAALARGLHVLQ